MLSSRWPRSPSLGKCSRRFCGSSRNCGRSHHQRQRETFDVMQFKSNRQKECVQMPGKMARSDPRPGVRVTRGAGSSNTSRLSDSREYCRRNRYFRRDLQRQCCRPTRCGPSKRNSEGHQRKFSALLKNGLSTSGVVTVDGAAQNASSSCLASAAVRLFLESRASRAQPAAVSSDASVASSPNTAEALLFEASRTYPLPERRSAGRDR
jgi:hypothetical protein